jgi:hypothetical protein
MNEFRIRLANAMTAQGVLCADADDVINRIMNLVKEAIETPLVSSEIDTWIVRTGLGKTGTRVNAIEIGDKRIETVDRFSEIYCRVYETERRCNLGPVEASQAAERVVKSLMDQGAISGPQ